MAESYVNMDKLNEIASSLNSCATALSGHMTEFSSGTGKVVNGWNDDTNSAIFQQKVTEFSTATNALIAEITNYANFMADCANNKYIPAQQDAIKAMLGGG